MRLEGIKKEVIIMNKLNNKGFTLVELIATIVLLTLVMSVGKYAIINIINNSKEKDYELFIQQVKDASETYYIECGYASNIGAIDAHDGEIKATPIRKLDEDTEDICMELANELTLGKLVTAGFLKANGKNEDGSLVVINPKDKQDISNCQIKISYENNKVVVTPVNNNGNTSCPDSY